jgi:hypothetical protein
MATTQERLEIAEKIICEPTFRQNKGLGNEVGYYVFDYPAKDELIVREWVRYQQGKSYATAGFCLIVFDLYEVMLEIFAKEGCLEQFFIFEKEYGLEGAAEIASDILRLTEDENQINEYIKSRLEDNAVVLLTGVGKCYPVLRSHKVLNNLHQVLDSVPVVLLFPGKYDGRELVLFDSIKDDNYYRAFKLV